MRVITSDKLIFLIAEAWVNSVNIMSGFKKCGIFFQLTLVWCLIDSLLLQRLYVVSHLRRLTQNQIPAYLSFIQKRYKEQCDLNDPGYVAWLKNNHPDAEVSTTLSSSHSSSASGEKQNMSGSKADLTKILVLSQPMKKKASTAKCT